MSVSSTPTFDPEGLKHFDECMKRTRCYLEYGCGGSTLYAANAKVQTIISVDTDQAWVNAVKAALTSTQTQLIIEYCDVGEVAEWGTPKNRNKAENFWRYIVLPWQNCRNTQLHPDMVLIDGRFRVAAFLYSLLSARVGTPILFDDYFDRPHYHIVESFSDVQERHGRMAAFSAGKQFSVPLICETILKYSMHWS